MSYYVDDKTKTQVTYHFNSEIDILPEKCHWCHSKKYFVIAHCDYSEIHIRCTKCNALYIFPRNAVPLRTKIEKKHNKTCIIL